MADTVFAGVKIRLVASLRQFDDLAPAWRELTEHSGQTSPLLSHDWFACSWRAAGPACRRELIVVEDAAGPAAFIPLTRSRARIRGLPVRRLGLLAPADPPFVDVPIAGSVEEVLSTFLADLRNRRDWDVMSLVRVPGHSPTYKGLHDVLPGQFVWRFARHEQSPYLVTAGSWQTFVQRLSADTRAVCLRIDDELRRRGDVSLEEHRHVDTDSAVFADVMEVFWASWASWASSPTDGGGLDQSLPRFLRELTRRASANGWLRLWIARVKGRAVATEYQLGNNGALHSLRRDHDAGAHDTTTARSLCLGLVRSLFNQGDTLEYDLGPTATPPDWASGTHESHGLDIYAPTTYGRILGRLATGLRPAARHWTSKANEPCA